MSLITSVKMAFDIKVAATGIVALCLALSAVLFISSAASPDLQGVGDKFFTLAVTLIFIVIVLTVVGVRIKFP